MTGKICASLSSYTGEEDLSDADMVEVRLDLLGKVPYIKGKDTLVTFRGDIDLSILPKGFDGSIDIGESSRPETDLEIVSSYHDYDGTPSEKELVSHLTSMSGDIVKGAFNIRDFEDLHNIFRASRKIDRRHVILGMGEFGTITRIRKDILGNEFSFGYVGEPTAPGQLSVKEMKHLGDGCMILGIVGHPLTKSSSPIMHKSALEIKGLNGIYLKFDTDNLEHCSDVIREYNITGMNVTIPHKQKAVEQMDCVDKTAEKVGAINTIFNENGKLTGYNTDIIGIDVAMEKAGFEPKDKRAVIMGSGGSARACAFALTRAGCNVTITGRNETTAKELAKDLGCDYRPKESIPLQMTDLIVNCTPVGMYNDGKYPVNLEQLNHHHVVFDMVYGKETPLMSLANTVGARIVSGSDMLAGQGAASFSIWTGIHDVFKIMRSVIQ